ncbi:glycosyltransferase [Neolewinella agarilytica]|uniref:glycosyltransferase n=1 Tax=Neolewinella agarilytica TaxID=478744 RepID=UPI0023521E4A|nr:nucleotide disphospho-sugar-binding domain-containing protein [Neolewinella agarilytica]
MATQPKVLVFAFDLLAHYTRCLRVAELLSNEYEFLFQSSDYDAVVHQQGFSTFNCLRLAEKELVAQGCQEDIMNWPGADLELVMLAQSEAIQQYQPVFVIGDMSPTLRMATERTGVKYISITNAYLSRYYDAPFEAPDFLKKLGADVADVPPFYRNKLSDMKGFMAVSRSQKEFRFLRRRYGLAKQLNLALELEGDQTWICDTKLFHPLKDNLPKDIEEIGPLRFSPKGLKEKDQVNVHPDRKTILVTMGSSGNYAWLQQLADQRFADYDFLVCGSTTEENLPENIRYFQFADFNKLMPQVDLVICHGGNGSLYQALAAGKPIICFPGFFEQLFNAERIEENGWGASYPEGTSTEDLLAAIETWVGRSLLPIAETIAKMEETQSNLLRKLTSHLLASISETELSETVA